MCSDQIQGSGIGCTDLTLYVCTDSVKALKDISVRYYFDASGMDISSLDAREVYDQAAIESGADGVLTGPELYKDNIYYVEIKWDGYAIANSNKNISFSWLHGVHRGIHRMIGAHKECLK